MYSDLFDQLGGGAGGGAGTGRNRGGAAGGGGAASAPQTPPPLVSCKAGKIVLKEPAATDEEATATTTSFLCQPDTKRGEIRLVYQDSALQWQWYDRRENSVVDTHIIVPSDGPAGTFERVPLSGKKHQLDRIYVWTRPNNKTETNKTEPPAYNMYWMQNASEEKEDEIVAQINQYLADPASAVPKDDSSGTGAAAAGSSSSSGAAGTTAGRGGATGSGNQVDALSTILENLGMPQSTGAAGGDSGAAATSSAAAGGGGTLTLADLQGAMAGMQQQQQQQSVVTPLTEVVTPAAVTSLLDQAAENTAMQERLLPLLPEGQRTVEQLQDNLRSPQVQQTLRSLTEALLPDDAGNMDGFYSVLANFNLEQPTEPLQATMSNPIQAFLDAILKKVEQEKKKEQEEEQEEKTADGGDNKDKDNKDDDNKDADGDEKMQEEAKQE